MSKKNIWEQALREAALNPELVRTVEKLIQEHGIWQFVEAVGDAVEHPSNIDASAQSLPTVLTVMRKLAAHLKHNEDKE